MGMTQHDICLKVENTPTVLVNVIQIIKRRRININQLIAEDESETDARIKLNITADDEQLRLIKTQMTKLVDVLCII